MSSLEEHFKGFVVEIANNGKRKGDIIKLTKM
jgi:hypothetical protein